MDFADARRRMVDGQLRPNRVTDLRLLEAMRSLPRESFLPAAQRSLAYADEAVALPGGAAMTSPMVLARLVQLAAPRPGNRALVAPAGTGYAAAVLAHMGVIVTAVEEDAGQRDAARQAISACLPGGVVRLTRGDPAAGFAAAAPYDIILIEGEVPEVPSKLAAQLAEGGRLVTVLSGGGHAAQAVLCQRIAGSTSTIPAFDCAAPPLAAFARDAGFVF